MNEHWIDLLDQEIEAVRPALAQDVIHLIGIESVRGEPAPGAPFGKGPRAMLDAVMAMGTENGYCVTDYGVGVVSLAMRPGQPDVGIWLHGDVVPVGEGWRFPPFHATEHQGCIIGRGATDNKGQLCAIFHVMQLFRKHNIPLRYNLAMYVGSDEESGMHDMRGVEGNPDARGFIHTCTPPRLSLVPDGSFPVGYGGKGSLNLTLRSDHALSGVRVTANLPFQPGKGWIETGDERIEAFVPPRHGAHANGEGNVVTQICSRLLERSDLAETDRGVFSLFRQISLDAHCEAVGLDRPSREMTAPVLSAKALTTEEGHAQLTVNIRYPDSLTAEELADAYARLARNNGVTLTSWNSVYNPYLLDKELPVIGLLADIANGITGDDKPPYTLSGGTYAHFLPNALVYGMDGCLPPEGFPKDRGSAHGLDELVSLDRLQRAMRIYARALLALNETDL